MPLFRAILVGVSLGTLCSKSSAVPVYDDFQHGRTNSYTYIPQYIDPKDIDLSRSRAPNNQLPYAAAPTEPGTTHNPGTGMQENFVSLLNGCSSQYSSPDWVNGQTGCWSLGQFSGIPGDTAKSTSNWQTLGTNPSYSQYQPQAFPASTPESAQGNQMSSGYNAVNTIPVQSGQVPSGYNAGGFASAQYQANASPDGSVARGQGYGGPPVQIALPQGNQFLLALSFQPREDKLQYLQARVERICRSSAEHPMPFGGIHQSKSYIFEVFLSDMAQQLAELIEYAESGHSTFRLGPQKPAFHLTAQELFEGLESSKIVMLFYWDNTAGSFIIEFPYLLDGNTMVLDCRQLWKFLTTAHLASSYVMFDGPINHDDIKSARSVLFQTLRPLRGRFAAALNVAH